MSKKKIETTINQRIEMLINDFYGANNSKFSRAIGVTPSVIGNILGERKGNPSFEVIKKIIDANADISPDWLMTGNGDMLRNPPVPEVPSVAAVPSANQQLQIQEGIPLYDIPVAAGNMGFDGMLTEDIIKARYVVPDFVNVDFMIYVKGSSMYPKYSSGDIVACRIISSETFIQWGKVYVVATREQGLLVKRINPSEHEDCLLAISDNEKYKPFDIPKEEILGVALVVGVIRLE